jgi:hypothetical protein
MFLRNGVDFALAGPDLRDKNIHLAFLGANAEPDAQEPLAGHSNYFLGNDSSRWIRNVSLYSDIRYNELYHGVSLDFYGNGQELEHDFHVDPGADPSQIAFRLGDVSKIKLSDAGEIEIQSAHGVLTLRKPIAYQTLADGRHNVDAKFLLSSDGTVRFAIGRYDARRPLVIDPVYVFSTYLGGTGTDQTAGVTADASGNILVVGTTTSTDFPTANAFQSSLGSNNQSVFVSKFDPTGKTLIYSTYFGGSSQALGAPSASGGAIAVDAAGDAIIAGLASSTNIPQAGAIGSPTCQTNNECFFLASLSADGSKLNYSGLIGGGQGNYSFGLSGDLAVDGAGNAYLAGTTDDSNFQITAGTLATSAAGYPNDEAFVLKVGPTGKLLYSTVIPGNDTNSNDLLQPFTNDFMPSGIAVDASGDVTIAGTSGLGLPTTTGVVGAQFPNAYINVENPSAGFVLQLNPTASAINFASYLPGTDYGFGLAVDAKGNFYVTGGTQETDLPVSANAYQKAPVTISDGQIEGAYVVVLNPHATAIVAATYAGAGALGGYGFRGIALDSHNNIFIGGNAFGQDFPLLDPFVTEYEFTGSSADMVLTELNPDLSALEFSTYLGSVDPSFGGSLFAGIATDKADHLLATGTTASLDFPTTQGSFEPQLPPPANPPSLITHSFVTVFDMSTPAPAVCLDTFVVSFGNVNAGTSATQTFHVTNCGNAPLSISSMTSSDPTVVVTQSCQTIAAGATCPVTLTFTPVSSNSTNGTVTLSDNAVTIPQTISFSGQGIAPKIVPSNNPLSFGHVLVGAPAVSSVLMISNRGEAPLTINSVSVSGAGFSLVNNGCTQPLAAGYGICSLGLSFAAAGSGSQTGSVVISSSDPATPQLTVALTGVGDTLYAVPSIGSISAPTLLIDNGPVTFTISGANFYAQSVAYLNGVALATTFQGNNELQVVIPASSLTALGEQYLTVVNPLPGGGVSASATVTPYQTLVIQPSALVSVPTTGMLYAAIPASAPANPNTVIPIDPATGAQGAPIPVGNNPMLLAASSDGAYLFVANQTDLTVQRINLTTNAVEKTYPYTPNIYCSTCEDVPATDLETVPGAPQEVLLSQGSWLSLYNDAGLVNYVPNDGICCYADPSFGSIALAGSPLTIYGLPFSFGGDYFQIADLTSSGLQYTRPTGNNNGPNNTTGALVISDGTLLYTSDGQVWNPATQTQIGTFPVQIGNVPSSEIGMALDTALGQIYSVGQQTTGNSIGIVVSAYGMKTYSLTGSLVFPQIYWPTESSLVRWGSDGLSFIGPGVGLTDNEVYLLRSSVVSPQAPDPTPTLTSVSPVSANAGGPAFTLTVNGTGFLSTSVVEWNGTTLSTVHVSAQQLTASVPASDIADAGTAQVSVFSPAPGGGSSNAIPFSIAVNNPVPVIASLSPAFVSASGAEFALKVSGSSFTSGSTVYWGSTALVTQHASATQLTAQVTAAEIASAGITAITVQTPTPGGGTSNSRQFEVDSAASDSAGAPSFTTLTAIATPGSTATYAVTLPSTATDISATCLNLPSGATCTYSAATGAVTIATSATTPAGTYQITAVFAETLPGAAAAMVFLPILLLPLLFARRKWAARRIGLMVFLALALAVTVASGCGGGSGGGQTQPQTHEATSSGVVTLTVQ